MKNKLGRWNDKACITNSFVGVLGDRTAQMGSEVMRGMCWDKLPLGCINLL